MHGPAAPHGEETISYHLRELEIAQDPLDRRHLMPPIQPWHKTILDIGCGMGQTLMAAGLADDVAAYGVDVDAEAIEAGRQIAPATVHLQVGEAEQLKFPDEMFDFVFCRGALPYMLIDVMLGEVWRVLRPGGEVWLSLHAWGMLKERAKESLRAKNYKDVAFCGFVGLNGILFHATGLQMNVRGRRETFQTEQGMRRAFRRAGLECTEVRRGEHFVVSGRRP